MRHRDETFRIVRFGIAGAIATAVHYAVLTGLLEGAGMRSAALANAIAAVCGITVSYFGNRRFVLRSRTPHRLATPRFLAAYGFVIGVHGGLMALWADWAGLSYSVGFVIFTAISAIVTYLANREYVFQDREGELLPTTDVRLGQ